MVSTTTTRRYLAVSGGVLSADPDSTQEFRVITNNFNAEYGRNTGAIIDVVTKSGTNTFHGNAYEFGRWNAFGGARDWFNRTGAGPQDPYIRNQFGYSIGGPIIKDKTFFFFNHEIAAVPHHADRTLPPCRRRRSRPECSTIPSATRWT